MTWIFFTFLAAFMQAWRNAFQNQLSKEVNVIGSTLARFLWGSPMAVIYLFLLYFFKPADLPNFSFSFFLYVICAAFAQILATILLIKLFKMKNFAIGAGLAKSEALVAAILGMLFFQTYLSLLGWIGVLIGSISVFLLSSNQVFRDISLPTILLGLGCGASFALTSLWIREASLVLKLPFPHGAAWVLLCVISLQTLTLLSYIIIFDKPTLKLLLQKFKLTLLTSTAGCLTSIGWFSAMSLEAVPLVKTLGQIEIFFSLLIAKFWFKDSFRKRDFWGLFLIIVAAVMIIYPY